MEWKDCRRRSVQSYHQVNGDDLDASKVSNSRCVRVDAALSLRPIRHPFAAFFLAKKNPLRLDSDGLWLQSRLKPTND